MKRHEMWRGQYRSRRYIEHLTDEEVRQRAKDVFLNMLVITEEAKIVGSNVGSGLAIPYPWPNNPVELTAHSVRFFGYFLHFLLWAAAHRER